MTKLRCGCESFSATEEYLGWCRCCGRAQPIKETKYLLPDIWASNAPLYDTHEITFTCGHKNDEDRLTGIKGMWCMLCQLWCEIDLLKEKKMSWNGKKFWVIYLVENGHFHSANQCKYDSLAAAEREAETRASSNGKTYLVLESVSGFQPKQNTERVKFRK